MKIALIIALIFNFLLETLAAVSLIAGPGGLGDAGQGGQWSMHYGFAALAIASSSLWLWPNRHDRQALTSVLGILLIFHTGLSISLAVAGDQMGGLVAHSILAVLLLVLFTQRKRIVDAET